MSHRDVFTGIYIRGGWGTGSGTGSAPDTAAPYCAFVTGYIRAHQISSVLDLGCGDGRLAAVTDWAGAAYTGLDVATTGHDIRGCHLPAAGLVLIKDVLQHWATRDIWAFFPRLARYRRVLITNSAAGVRTNLPIATGGFRSLDLAAPPFSWPVREVFRWEGDEIKSVAELAS